MSQRKEYQLKLDREVMAEVAKLGVLMGSPRGKIVELLLWEALAARRRGSSGREPDGERTEPST